jgi:predicted nucleic acid-binding protein
LVRAALGRRVLPLLKAYARSVDFLAPELAATEAHAYLPGILAKRGLSPDAITQRMADSFQSLPEIVTFISPAGYASREIEARRRLLRRDESDWPYIALALTVGCPIWTEDLDFFGCGVPIWTTDRVEIYLAAEQD